MMASFGDKLSSWRKTFRRWKERVWIRFCLILNNYPLIVLLVLLAVIGSLAAVAFSYYGELIIDSPQNFIHLGFCFRIKLRC